MTRVAITGATGFIGTHLAWALHQAGHSLTVVARTNSDVSRLPTAQVYRGGLDNADELAGAFHDCAAVYHLAGAVDFGGDWERFESANVRGTRNVLTAAQMAGVPRVVHCSSIVAVGASQTPERLDENARWNLGPLHVPYVTTKRQAEELALATSRPGFEVVVANPGCVVGPGDATGSEFGVMCRRFWAGRLPIHFGGGNSFVDVRDVVAGLVAAWHRGRPGSRYLLTGTNRSMGGFFSALARASDRPIPRLRMPNSLAAWVAWLEANFSSGRRRRAYLSPAQARLTPWFFFFDHARATRELGFQPRPLAESLRDAFLDQTARAA